MLKTGNENVAEQEKNFGIADLFGGDAGTAAKAGQIFNMIDAATQNRTINTVLAGQYYLVSCLSCSHVFAVLL